MVAFANEAGAREKQDVGLNGLSTEQEWLFEYNGTKPYADYVASLRNKVDPDTLATWELDAFSPLNDPAGDNYHYYRGDDYDRDEVPVLLRYKRYNGTEGNSPEMLENASYGGTVCAERVAFTKALSEGNKEFTCLAVVGKPLTQEQFNKTLPCGYCRQFLSEYTSPDFLIYSYDDVENKVYSYTLAELLPEGFSFK